MYVRTVHVTTIGFTLRPKCIVANAQFDVQCSKNPFY